MKRNNSNVGRIMRTCAALLVGGSLFGACNMRIKDAFVQGSEAFVLTQLLNPNSAVYLFSGTPLDPCFVAPNTPGCPTDDENPDAEGGA